MIIVRLYNKIVILDCHCFHSLLYNFTNLSEIARLLRYLHVNEKIHAVHTKIVYDGWSKKRQKEKKTVVVARV